MSIYDFEEYKKYLNVKAFLMMQSERGIKSKLARHLNCQTGFISQVLNGMAHFSLEHAIKINDFVGHSEDEAHFFMLLVQLSKAGNHDLKLYYKSQMEKILNRRRAHRQ